jgi:predicted HNH restriction endonuclease
LIPNEIEDEKNVFYEGAKKAIIVNAYERNYKAREECIKYYGNLCYTCGFDFGKVYGTEYLGKIHVHHIVPLNEIGEKYKCNPINDLRPVCPNCHLILHTKVNGVYVSIDELRNKMKNKI